jgi:hypothetical protein
MSSFGASAICTRKIRCLGTSDRVELSAARQHVQAVEDKPDGRMIRLPDDLPGVAVIVDVSTPGQRLEGDAEAVFRG